MPAFSNTQLGLGLDELGKKAILMNCYASYGPAKSSIWQLKTKCYDEFGYVYTPLYSLANEIIENNNGNKIVIAMSHPLQFVANLLNLVSCFSFHY